MIKTIYMLLWTSPSDDFSLFKTWR